MNNHKEFLRVMKDYFDKKGLSLDLEIDLHEASLNENAASPAYLYEAPYPLKAISMDRISQQGHRAAYGIQIRIIWGLKQGYNAIENTNLR